MTTESIQYGGQVDRQSRTYIRDRRDRWSHIGETFGFPLTEAQLDELPALTDRVAATRFFPHLLDVELDELLWAANVDEADVCACRAAA